MTHKQCDFGIRPLATQAQCEDRSYVATKATFTSCQSCGITCPVSGAIICSDSGQPLPECQNIITPAVITGTSSCSFHCSTPTCDSTPLATMCETCLGGTFARTVSCKGTITYDYSGKSTDTWTPLLTQCGSPSPLSSIVVSNSCGYKWSFSPTALETTKACAANQCGSQCTAPTYCLREVVYTSGALANQVSGYQPASPSSCSGNPPSVTPVPCQYAWSTSSSIVTTPNITTYCPSVDSGTGSRN